MTFGHLQRFSPSLDDTFTSSQGGVSCEWWSSLDALRSKLRHSLATPTPDRDLSRLLADELTSYSSSLTVSSVPRAVAIVSGEGWPPLMRAFAWIGRWRPTTVAGLVLTVTNSALDDSIKPNRPLSNQLSTPSISLSQSQLQRLEYFKENFAKAESQISNEFEKFQTKLMDASMVRALKLRGGKRIDESEGMTDLQRVLDVKLARLQQLLNEADNLRLDFLSCLSDLLSPVQAAYCVLAGLDMTFALRSDVALKKLAH